MAKRRFICLGEQLLRLAEAELEVLVVLSPLPLGTPTLCCKSQRQTVQLKIVCTGKSPADLHPNIKVLLIRPET